MDDEQKRWDKVRGGMKLDRKQLLRRMRRAEAVSTKHAHKFVIGRINNIRLVSREITLWLVFVGVLIAGLGVQILWSQDSYMMAAPQGGGAYVEGVVGRIGTLNPLFSATDAEASAARLVFSSLYNYDRTGSLHQDLATSMVADSTQKIYTVTMRGDAKWHDGKPVTAQDVVFTINLIKNPATRSPLRVNWLDISATALNDTTVQFTLPAVYAAFPQALTFPVMPMHLLKSLDPSAVRESVFSQSPVGSGPFKFSRLQQIDSTTSQKVVHLVANTKYYAGRPKLDRFELRSYPTETALIRAVNNGEVSGVSDISVTGVKDVKTKQATITSEPVDSGVYLLFNTQNPVLKEAPVRQALQLATNTADIRKALGGGVLPLDGPLLESQLSGANVPHAPAADIAKANLLLESNGWKLVNGYRVKNGQTLQLGITTTKDSEYEAVLKQVEPQWRKVGVKVVTNVIDTSSATSTFVQNVLQARNFDVLLYELSIGADPDVYAYWHSSQIGMSGYNFSNYSNRIVDASLASARSRLEPDLRNAKYSLFVQQWLADVPAVALYQPAVEYVTASGVQAVKSGGHLVTLADRYADVQYWTVENGSVYKTP